jgi:Fe-S-cluster containining protein
VWKGPVYDCQSCGACCAHQGPFDGKYVYLHRDEARRMKRLGLSVIHADGDAYLGARSCGGGRPTCVAFRGRVGGECGCGIYDDRPTVCRAFEVGEALCREARERAGLPV